MTKLPMFLAHDAVFPTPGFGDLWKFLYSVDPFLKEDTTSSYPKYNIIKDKENKDISQIVMAVAGLDKSKISVTTLKNKLAITYEKELDSAEAAKDDTEIVVQHISNRSFKQVFTVPEGREIKIIKGPKIEDGLLTITVEAYIPDDCKEIVHEIEYTTKETDR